MGVIPDLGTVTFGEMGDFRWCERCGGGDFPSGWMAGAEGLIAGMTWY